LNYDYVLFLWSFLVNWGVVGQRQLQTQIRRENARETGFFRALVLVLSDADALVRIVKLLFHEIGRFLGFRTTVHVNPCVVVVVPRVPNVLTFTERAMEGAPLERQNERRPPGPAPGLVRRANC
jgi:hypothetical protein